MGDDAQQIIQFSNEYLNHVKRLNPTFKPKYGSRVIEKLYNAALYELMNRRVNDKFVTGSDDLFI